MPIPIYGTVLLISVAMILLAKKLVEYQNFQVKFLYGRKKITCWYIRQIFFRFSISFQSY